MKKELRYAMYIVVTIICVISIFVGVYSQFFKKQSGRDNPDDPDSDNPDNTISYAQIKEDFKDLFTNKFISNDYDDSAIPKENEALPLVYTGIELSDESDGKYDINISLPVINIKGVTYNKQTEDSFVSKLNDILQNAELYTICDFNYISYINDNILSVAIMASIKEGDSAQRIIMQSYNYNLETMKDVSFNDILEVKGLKANDVENKIKTIVRKVAQDSKSMHDTGYNVFERDTDSPIYETKNINNFILGPEGKLYIIFAYGNSAFTSEMDIIEF